MTMKFIMIMVMIMILIKLTIASSRVHVYKYTRRFQKIRAKYRISKTRNFASIVYPFIRM